MQAVYQNKGKGKDTGKNKSKSTKQSPNKEVCGIQHALTLVFVDFYKAFDSVELTSAVIVQYRGILQKNTISPKFFTVL